ncbi:acyl-CoA N-acyltransferase [Coniochaeta ligniaria NRRL 30616]|uniref:N-alpha-acetyltransferase 40 n=1 Tax=Coniochaeta ligniaria NRRL 30616 TaxID=1408157 RepID=A0A1J7JKB7_9PEZI|nr:acyl-CoA N-acyltransferase [Coniochaeta ligniaria NRRL 30616]
MGPKRRRASVDPLEIANAKTDQIFVDDYLTSTAVEATPWTTTWLHPRTGQKYSLNLQRAGNLSDEDLKACFDLIAETSKGDYEASRGGWHPKKKLTEMRSPDLRYILVKDENGCLAGFTSLMPTWEEGQPVVYCYEIHLKPHLQRTGLGRLLMGFLCTVAKNIPPVDKVMLTCFLSNERGLDFYGKLGFQKDEISPVPRKLRFGKTFTPDYAILSKPISRPMLPPAVGEESGSIT